MSSRKLQTVPHHIVRSLLACIGALAVGAAPGQQSSLPKAPANPGPPPSMTGAEIARATSAASASTAAEIQRINERMTLLQAQLNELELQAKISAKRKELGSAGTSTGTGSAFDSKAGLPLVQSVAGLKGRLEAVLVFPGGVTQRVAAGDLIQDRKVAKVSLNEVVLTDLRGQKVQRLAFGSAQAVRENGPLALPAPPSGSMPSPAFGR